jgi:hypothetical protein
MCVLGQQQKNDRPPQFENRDIEAAPQIRRQRAASRIRVEKTDDVRCGPHRQKIAIRHLPVEPGDSLPEHQRVPAKVEDDVRHHHGEEEAVVRVVKRGKEAIKRYLAEDERKNANRQ